MAKRRKRDWSIVGKMKVGDSFLLPKTKNAPNSVHVAAFRFGIKVNIRNTSEGLRCWRVDDSEGVRQRIKDYVAKNRPVKKKKSERARDYASPSR
jgi:hypothetical protein